MSCICPLPATLAKYGLSEAQWRIILQSQKGVCGVCKRLPPSKRLCIDHEHVRGFKTMPDAQKRLYVRGLCCHLCNRYCIGRGVTLQKAYQAYRYLHDYETIKAARADQ